MASGCKIGTINSTAIGMWDVLAIFFESYCASACFAIVNEALKLKIIFCLVYVGCVNDIAKQEKHDAKN